MRALALSLGSLALGLLSCLAAQDAAAQGAAPRPAVVVAPASRTEVSESAVFSGRVVADQRVELRARVTGFLEERDFTEGARVAKGDLLFQLERGPYEASVAEFEGSLGAAEAALKLAKIDRDRQATLVQKRTVAQATLDTAEATLGQAEGEVLRLKAALSRAQLDLDYTEIRAPFGGIVGLAAYDVGALVGPESGPLATLVSTDPIGVEFPVPARTLLQHKARVAEGKVSNQAAVSLTLSDGSTYALPGDINFVDAAVASGTDTVLLRAAFANPQGQLLDGALVRVELKIESPELALTVPRQAVQRDLGGDFVLTVGGDGVAQRRGVVIEGYSGGLALVSEGLEDGEQVIVEGVNKVRPGSPVDAAPVDAAPAGAS